MQGKFFATWKLFSTFILFIYPQLHLVLFLSLKVTAVFAADAVARMSGTVGVAAVTAGPGLTNTVTAVKNAQMAESPLLLMG